MDDDIKGRSMILIRESQYRNNAFYYTKGGTAYFLCEETRVLILIFIEIQRVPKGKCNRGSSLAVRASETYID